MNSDEAADKETKIHVNRMRRGSESLGFAIEVFKAGGVPNTPSTLMWCKETGDGASYGIGFAAK